MNSDVIFHTRTHLGAVLKPGDTVMGYMLATANFNNEAWDNLNQEKTPQVILVRKTYPNRRKKSKVRGWRLKSIVRLILLSRYTTDADDGADRSRKSEKRNILDWVEMEKIKRPSTEVLELVSHLSLLLALTLI